MARPGDLQMDGEVREGLLCPICLQDYGSVTQLQDHFDVAHSTEDHDILQSLKGFIGKAKRKILKQEVAFEDAKKIDVEDLPPHDTHDEGYLWEPQELGRSVRHMEYFKTIRETRVDHYVIETNKLLIRLDKLITDAPEDPEKRKLHEKKIVSWIPDADVRLCPGCARAFGLSRRRHHCRLCGGVMCQSCSEFIEFFFARKLIRPTLSHEAPPTLTRPPMQRRNSSSSLLSVVSAAGEPHIRVCRDCKALLVRRDQQVELQTSKPIIVQMYERMRSQMEEIEKLVPVYYKMIDSLCLGETTYNLADAHQVRVKLTKLAENIDIISRKISTLGTNSDVPQSPKSLQLQGGVRLAASYFLRDTVLGLPKLPTEAEVAKRQKTYQQEVQRRIQQEKQALLEAQAQQQLKDKKENQKDRSQGSPKKEGVSPDGGWTVSNSVPSSVSPEDDPMLQQIRIIENYIQQARIDHKYDEVNMLETNLKELQQEYLRQQKNS